MATLSGLLRRQESAPPTAIAAADATVRVGSCRVREIGRVRALQLRCFRKSLAYRRTTLFSLWVWPDVKFLVARRGEEIVGAVIGDQHEGVSRVVSICVDPGAQRLGIGRELLAAIEQELPNGPMVLMVENTNASARALYLACDYRQVGIQRNYYGAGRDGIWMRKDRTVTQ